MVVERRKIGEYHPSIPAHLLGLMTLGVCNNCSPSGERPGWGEGVHLCSFLCPSEISLLIFLAFVSFPDLVLQFFSMQSKARPPTCFFFPQSLVSPTFGIQDTVFLPSSQLATVFWSILHG